MKYLQNIETLEQLKKSYREWAMKLHPDRGGSDEAMKELNLEYETLFQKVKAIHTSKDGEQYRQETTEIPQEFIHIISELMKLNNIRIEQLGCFLWVSGDTKPYRGVLKGLGLKWHSKKKCWYLPPKGYRRHGDREFSLDEIRTMYGSVYDSKIRRRELKEV